MDKNSWQEVKLGEAIEFNPIEKISANEHAKKIAMERILPKTRKIQGYLIANYKGGSKFKNGDTLMARITPCLENGKTSFVDILDKDEIAFGSTEFIVLREIENVSIDKFIYYLACSEKIRSIAIKSMVGSTGRQRVQQNVLEDTIVNLPPLPEQKAIAATLSCLDDMIELNNKTNKILEEMAQAIFKRWFVDFEFPDENRQPYKSSGGEMEESELGPIPKGWRVSCIGDYIKVKSGFAFKSIWWQNTGTPVVKIKDIENGTINFSDISHVSDDKVSIAQDFRAQGGDLLIAMTGATIGKFAIVPKLDQTVLVNQRVGKFFLGSHPLKRLGFIYCTLKREEIISQIKSRGDGSAQPNISPFNIESIEILLPTNQQLLDFNTLVKGFFELLIFNQAELTKLKELSNTLLPKLMSGEIRVPYEKEDA